MEQFQSITHCEACEGHRLKPEALAVKIGGKHVSEIASLSIREAHEWFSNVDKKFNKKQKI